jgi:hypothetical protein
MSPNRSLKGVTTMVTSRTAKRWLEFIVLLFGAYALTAHAQCMVHVVGYMHPYDVVPQQVCNFYGCSVVPTRIPCQHPIWGC